MTEKIETTRVEIVDGVISQNDCADEAGYSSHRRSRNWLAVVKPNRTCPGGLERNFLERVRGNPSYYHVNGELEEGTVLEIASDYYTGSGKKRPRREYRAILVVDENAVVLGPAKSTEPKARRDYVAWKQEQDKKQKIEESLAAEGLLTPPQRLCNMLAALGYTVPLDVLIKAITAAGVGLTDLNDEQGESQ